ncbi:hypothetical protein [Mycobacterium sp.]|uniref:hypothetical protein n=1 Tax=Mycobacterium sp. TaxID=1785 RepID=UPI003340768B
MITATGDWVGLDVVRAKRCRRPGAGRLQQAQCQREAAAPGGGVRRLAVGGAHPGDDIAGADRVGVDGLAGERNPKVDSTMSASATTSATAAASRTSTPATVKSEPVSGKSAVGGYRGDAVSACRVRSRPVWPLAPKTTMSMSTSI